MPLGCPLRRAFYNMVYCSRVIRISNASLRKIQVAPKLADILFFISLLTVYPINPTLPVANTEQRQTAQIAIPLVECFEYGIV
jgi:hypothetical protein